MVGNPTEADLAVYKDQLAEIERDLARGTIVPEEALRLRAEVGKRVIEADRLRSQGNAPLPTGKSGMIAVLVMGLTLAGALSTYRELGAPGYPDVPFEPRLAALDAGIATRPGQEAELARIGKARDVALDARLQAELSALSLPGELRGLFRQRLQNGEFQAAIRTQERLIAVLGEDSDTSDHANLALALVMEAGGYVSPEAETSLRESLRRDMTNELSRYLVGEMFLQGGRFDQAFRFWRPIAETGDPAAPWVVSTRERIETVAQLAGERYQLPEVLGPSAADVVAAGEMTPEERQAMIEGMVAQLSDRLATDGGTVEDWDRLIRSLAVLERLDQAQVIYDEAKVKFEGQPAELSFLRLAAVETGLNP
jgi:cytochrome c-type biogenesis protein CcmH